MPPYSLTQMRIFTGIRGSYGVFRFLQWISRVLNWFSPGFDREQNKKIRQFAALPEDYLNSQALPPLSGLPFGAWRVENNGCEVVAAYNALRYMEMAVPFSSVADSLECGGLLCNGLGGTNPAFLPEYFRRFGISTVTLRRKNAAAFDSAIEEGQCAVLSYWTGKRLRRPNGRWNTLHTVFLFRSGEVIIRNVTGIDREPAHYSTVSDFLADQSADPLCLMLLSRKST